MVEKTRIYDDAYKEYDPNDDETGIYTTIVMRYDAKYYQYGRTVYTILQFLGDVGGLQSSLLMVGAVLVSFYTHRLFLASIMKEMYYTKYDRGQAAAMITKEIQQDKSYKSDADIETVQNINQRVPIKPEVDIIRDRIQEKSSGVSMSRT